MRLPFRRTLLTVAVGLAGTVIAWHAGSPARARHHLATMLNIAAMPASVDSIDCVDFGFTDVLERCALSIAPADFDALLAGYQFAEPGASIEIPSLPGTSHTLCCGPEVGPQFDVFHLFMAFPAKFEHGGSVIVAADRSRSLVMVDLYIE